MTTVRRPLVRYHGGKWRLAEWIVSHFPAHRIYTEVYGGAASVLLRKPRVGPEIYNDLDGDMVNLLRVLRERGAELREAVRLTPYAREEFENSRLPCEEPVERARRTLVRGWMGYSSDSMTSLTGFRTYTQGRRDIGEEWAGFSNSLAAHERRLAKVIMERREAVDVLREHDAPNTLHYVDPPYVHSARMREAGAYGRGYRHEMGDADHESLAEVLAGLQGMVVLSGYPSPLYEKLYGGAGWRCVELATHAEGARERTECLWLCRVPEPEGLFSFNPDFKG